MNVNSFLKNALDFRNEISDNWYDYRIQPDLGFHQTHRFERAF